jgi:hypothetical protein
MPQGESKGLREARRRLNVLLDADTLDDAAVAKARAHVTRLEREGRGEDVMTGGPRAPTNASIRRESLNEQARKGKAARDSALADIRRANP